MTGFYLCDRKKGCRYVNNLRTTIENIYEKNSLFFIFASGSAFAELGAGSGYDGYNFAATGSLELYMLDAGPVRRLLANLSTPACCGLPLENAVHFFIRCSVKDRTALKPLEATDSV